MTVKIHIWKPDGGTVLNLILYLLIFQHLKKCEVFNQITSVGHVAMEIRINPRCYRYISHRPEDNKSDFHIKPVPAASGISFEDECSKRLKPPTVTYEIHGLDENKMIRHYDIDLYGKYSTYHFLTNNCSAIVMKLIFEGLHLHSDDYEYEYETEYRLNPYSILKHSNYKYISIGNIILSFLLLLLSAYNIYTRNYNFPYIVICLTILTIFFTLHYEFKIIAFLKNYWTPIHLDTVFAIIQQNKLEEFNGISINKIKSN